jgi:hypothetical protein
MTQCITQLTLGFLGQQPLVIDFDAPDVSSDGGAILLRQVDGRLGVTRWFAEALSDDRDSSRVVHDRLEQCRQRIYQIGLGYEDCNDSDRLRDDPMLKTVCGRLPKDEHGLSSQPTLSRFENAMDWATIRRLIRGFEESYVASLPADTSEVILDIDATDDETHGAQQLSFFHGYYDHHMYHPLLLFDGESGQLITVKLRPGNTHASRGAATMLARVIKRIKRRFPDVSILVRGDSGFCVPQVLETVERLSREYGDVDYLFGIAKNAVLLRLAEAAMASAEEMYETYGKDVQHFTEFDYAAGSWSHPRLVIAKAEHNSYGPNPRFVITSLRGFPPQLIYRAYCARGQCENLIKDLKNALDADRLSCSSFRANFFRLLLHSAAYRLMHELRCQAAAHSQELGRAQFDTLRLRILKVAALVKQSARRIHVRLPKAFPFARVYRAIASALDPPLPAT